MDSPLFKFEISGAELNRAARWLDVLAFGRPVPGQEYLSGIHVFADEQGSQVAFSGTDLDTYGVAVSPCTVRSSGRTVIPARLLAAIAKACTNKEVLTFADNDGGTCSVVGTSSSWTIPTMRDDHWPKFALRGDLLAELRSEDVTRAYGRVSASLAKEKIAPTWGGMAIDIRPGEDMRLVATDGFRMSVVSVPGQVFATERKNIILPGTAFDRALKGAVEGSLMSLSVNQGGFIVSGRGYRAYTRQLTEYPDWTRGLPKEHPNHSAVRVSVKELKDAIGRVSVLVEDALPLIMEMDVNGVTMSTTEDAKGTAHAFCEAHIQGEPHASVAFRPGYLNDILSTVDTKDVLFKFGKRATDALVAVGLDSDGAELPDWIHIVRPIDLSRRKKKA